MYIIGLILISYRKNTEHLTEKNSCGCAGCYNGGYILINESHIITI